MFWNLLHIYFTFCTCDWMHPLLALSYCMIITDTTTGVVLFTLLWKIFWLYKLMAITNTWKQFHSIKCITYTRPVWFGYYCLFWLHGRDQFPRACEKPHRQEIGMISHLGRPVRCPISLPGSPGIPKHAWGVDGATQHLQREQTQQQPRVLDQHPSGILCCSEAPTSSQQRIPMGKYLTIEKHLRVGLNLISMRCKGLRTSTKEETGFQEPPHAKKKHLSRTPPPPSFIAIIYQIHPLAAWSDMPGYQVLILSTEVGD